MWRIFLLAILSISQASDKCRALVLGGGNDYGAYQAGAVIGLIKSLPEGEAEWDVVTGTGVGSINGLLISQVPKGEESSLIENLSTFWKDFTTDQFYKEWKHGWINALSFQNGLYNTEPLKETIQNHNKGKFERFFVVNALDLRSADYLVFNSSITDTDKFNLGIYASASDYGYFPIVYFGDDFLVSGGVLHLADIFNAITRCLDLGFSRENIIVDAVLVSGKEIPQVDSSHYNSIDFARWYLVLKNAYKGVEDIQFGQHYYPEVNWRNLVFPSQKLINPKAYYGFTSEELADLLKIGESDTTKLVTF